MQCQAKAKSTGEQCRRFAVNGKKVCTVHGGLTPGGIASPHYKHGRHSKYLPNRLGERYAVAISDPEILNLSAEIALVDARITDVLGRVDSGESGRRWRELGKARREFVAAQRKQDQDKMADALNDILMGIREGQADFEAWAEVVDLLERRRRLVESEQKRRVAMHLVVKVEQAVDAMLQIADAVRDAALEHIDDGAVRRRLLGDVQSAIDRYVAAGVQQQAVGGD